MQSLWNRYMWIITSHRISWNALLRVKSRWWWLFSLLRYNMNIILCMLCALVTQVYATLTEVLWMTATARFWCVCIPPSLCAWNVNLEVLEWLWRSCSTGRQEELVCRALSFQSFMIHRLFWSVWQRWPGDCDLSLTGAKLSLYHGVRCPWISDFPLWWWWAAAFWETVSLNVDFIFHG